MKNISKSVSVFFVMISIFLLCISSLASTVSDVPLDLPDDGSEPLDEEIIMEETTELYLVCAAKNSTIYANDKKTKLFTVAEGDSMIIDARKRVSDNNWSMILVDIEGYDNATAYIKTSSLVKTKSGALSKKRPSNVFHGMFASVSKSKYVYKTDVNSEKVGIIRKGVRLPVYTDSKNRHRVCTYDGAATVLPQYLKLSIESGWTWG